MKNIHVLPADKPSREAWEKYHKEQYCYNYFMEMVRNKKPNKTNFKYL